MTSPSPEPRCQRALDLSEIPGWALNDGCTSGICGLPESHPCHDQHSTDYNGPEAHPFVAPQEPATPRPGFSETDGLWVRGCRGHFHVTCELGDLDVPGDPFKAEEAALAYLASCRTAAVGDTETPPAARIGEHGGLCNRTACRAPNARWFNKSTRKYYCDECGPLLTQVNQRDAEAAGLHPLCELHPAPLDSEPREPTRWTEDSAAFVAASRDSEVLTAEDMTVRAAPQETPEGEPSEPALEAVAQLRAFAREHLHGRCKILSLGDGCPCNLCAVDNLAAALATHTRSLAALRSAVEYYADQRKKFPRSGAEITAFQRMMDTLNGVTR